MEAIFEAKAKTAAQVIQHVLVNELHLAPAVKFVLTERSGLTWLIAIMDPLNLGKNIEAYSSPKTVHHLSTALKGVYVGLANHTGLRYGVLLSARPQLPRLVDFPGFERDTLRLGVSLRDELRLQADEIGNAIISGPPGQGKSNLLKLLAHSMRASGWKLYLADPQGHTFNPDIWNGLAPAPVAGSLEEVRALLGRLDAERLDRQAMFRSAAAEGIPPENLTEYNATASDPLTPFVLLFDESNTWLKQVVNETTDLARQIRKFGGHIILAGHDWHAADIPRSLSAQFATRIALSSNDDTAARVILNNDRWGKWTINKPAGRAVVRHPKFGYMPTQIYRITPEMERDWLSAAETLPALTADEQRMVRVAVEKLGGAFKIRDVAALSIQGEWTVRQTAESWEQRGWLEKPAHATASRRVTSKLADLAGISLTGTQASQGIIGPSQASQGFSQALTGLIPA